MLPQEKTKQKNCVTKKPHQKSRISQGRGTHESKQERVKKKNKIQQYSTSILSLVGLVAPCMPAQSLSTDDSQKLWLTPPLLLSVVAWCEGIKVL